MSAEATVWIVMPCAGMSSRGGANGGSEHGLLRGLVTTQSQYKLLERVGAHETVYGALASPFVIRNLLVPGVRLYKHIVSLREHRPQDGVL